MKVAEGKEVTGRDRVTECGDDADSMPKIVLGRSLQRSHMREIAQSRAEVVRSRPSNRRRQGMIRGLREI
jgi:hypothetical protein